MQVFLRCQSEKIIGAPQFLGIEVALTPGLIDTARLISRLKGPFGFISWITKMNFGLARLLLCKRGEGLLPKEGWLERQFALAQNEVTQRPELRARASQFANERRRR